MNIYILYLSCSGEINSFSGLCFHYYSFICSLLASTCDFRSHFMFLSCEVKITQTARVEPLSGQPPDLALVLDLALLLQR